MVLRRLRRQNHALSSDRATGHVLFSSHMAVVHCFRDDNDRFPADDYRTLSRVCWRIQRRGRHTYRSNPNSPGNRTLFLVNDRLRGRSDSTCCSSLPAFPKKSLGLNASLKKRRRLGQLPPRPRSSLADGHFSREGYVQSTSVSAPRHV
jgi:hypothetical protein